MLWKLDLALRFLYVLIAPVFLVAFAAIIPMAGPLVGAALATAVALAGTEEWRARTGRLGLIGRPLASLAQLGDYYREHPPRPLLYYVLYPILLPLWLFDRRARVELLLYRRVNGVALIVMAGLAALEYLRRWSGIPASAFVGQALGVLILQLLVTMALVMPIVTTIVAYHARGKRRALTALLVLAGLFAGGMAIHVARTDRPNPYVVGRLRYRALADAPRATEALRRGLAAAAARLDAGAAPDAARGALHAELESYWQADEARVFELYRAGDGTTIVYVNPRRHPTIWLGRARDGQELAAAARLPPDARARLARPATP